VKAARVRPRAEAETDAASPAGKRRRKAAPPTPVPQRGCEDHELVDVHKDGKALPDYDAPYHHHRPTAYHTGGGQCKACYGFARLSGNLEETHSGKDQKKYSRRLMPDVRCRV
jgi:hypothetical protein